MVTGAKISCLQIIQSPRVSGSSDNGLWDKLRYFKFVSLSTSLGRSPSIFRLKSQSTTFYGLGMLISDQDEIKDYGADYSIRVRNSFI